ncbi:MAG: prepilin-type N-terminal cleavage/methylation domain-containing protein [Victivallales bacterium]|nr:prepilin-type N-terminal cleavage/methylation domain-containing protein [Victivallales bacterium]
MNNKERGCVTMQACYFYGFSLIELLIVIAIIAIIVSMLLPALNKARSYAYSATCINNLKNLGICFISYSDNYDGYYPRLGDPGTGVPRWSDTIRKDAGLQENKTGSAIMRCPAAGDFSLTSNWYYFSYVYGYNPVLANGWWSASKYPNVKNISNLSCTSNGYLPSNKGMTSDIMILSDSWNLNDKKPYYRFSGEASVNPLHNGKANSLFFDGHVGSRFPLELKLKSGIKTFYNSSSNSFLTL